MQNDPLTRDEVKSVIEGRARARRVPMFIHFWTNPDAFGDRKGVVKDLLGRYPQDMQVVPFFLPSQYRGEHAAAPGYSWCPYPNPDAGRTGAIDEAVAMDERAVAAKFGSRLTIFAGLDVQQVIPWGTPDDVRREVRFLMETYWRPGEGRCMITAGNGITGDCPLASLEAFLDETFTYGQTVATR